MAIAKIKKKHSPIVRLISNIQSGTYVYYTHSGYTVSFSAIITKPNTSWSLCEGLPVPANERTHNVVGMIYDEAGKLVGPLYVNAQGVLQTHQGILSGTYAASGAYTTTSRGGKSPFAHFYRRWAA